MKPNINIRIELLKKSLYQKDLADALNIPVSRFYRMMRKELPPEEQCKLLDHIADMQDADTTSKPKKSNVIKGGLLNV